MKKYYLLSLCLVLILALSACSSKEPVSDTPSGTTEAPSTSSVVHGSISPEDMFSEKDLQADTQDGTAVYLSFGENGISSTSDSVMISGTNAVLTEEATYILTGTLENGSITVDAPDSAKLTLMLSGANISCSDFAPIYVKNADKVFITLAKATENSLTAGESFALRDENKVDAAIFSKADLTLKGEGSLAVSSPGGHGVTCKDDLVISGGSYTISAEAHGLDANDSIRIAAGELDISSGKDALHAENSDDAGLGFIYISGVSLTAVTEGDGISAGSWLYIENGSFSLNCGGGYENGEAHTESFGGPGGMGRPGGHGGFAPGSPPGTQTEEDAVSTKALKAAGNVTLAGGSYSLNSADDGVHSNSHIDLSGGVFDILTGDDGFHADGTLRVSGGEITVRQSYEGLEALHLLFSGGKARLVCSDDGLNAAGGADQSGFRGAPGFGASDGSIVISGGELDITASGDGIDANGTLEISGGYTTVCGPTRGDTATLDFDVSATISGGTFIGTGASGMAQSFTHTSQGVIAVSVGNQAQNTPITLSDKNGNLIISHSPELSFGVVILSSPDIVIGETYLITVGSASGEFEAY